MLVLHAHRLGKPALRQSQRLHEPLDENLADRCRLALRRQHVCLVSPTFRIARDISQLDIFDEEGAQPLVPKAHDHAVAPRLCICTTLI